MSGTFGSYRPLGFIAVIIVALLGGACGGGESSETSNEINAAQGGELSLGDDITVRIPAAALSEDATLTIAKPSEENPAPDPLEAGQAMGTAFSIDLGGQKLLKPATLELRYDATLLPEGMPEDAVFLTFYDEAAKTWIPVKGRIDPERDVIIVETEHLSWWNPFTWNWGAWIAVLDKVLQGNLVGWFEAVALLTDDCPQAGTTVSVDASRANNVIQGCIERDDPARPALRVVNPKSFFFEVKPTAGGNGYPPAGVLGPGDSLPFEASTADSTPLIISAEVTQKSGAYLVVRLFIQMLPGFNQLGIQTKQIACITERLADVSYVASAAEALLVDHNGAAAAEQIARMLGNADVMRRFKTAADDCGYGPAETWSAEGIKQIGAATATIVSATDFVANYFLNYHSEVAFNWVQPATPTPVPTPTCPVNDQSFCEFVRNVDSALKSGDQERFFSYLVFSPWDCSANGDLGSPCLNGEPPGTILQCTTVGLLNAGPGCKTRDQYASILTTLRNVHAVIYPSSPSLSGPLALGRPTGPLIIPTSTGNASQLVTLLLNKTNDGWKISLTLFIHMFSTDCQTNPACRITEEFIPWP